MSTKVGPGQIITPENPTTRVGVVSDFGNIRPELLLRCAIDFHNLEGRTDTTRAQTRDDSVVVVPKPNHLVFGPKPSRRRKRGWNGLTEEFCKGCFKLLKSAPIHPRIIKGTFVAYWSRRA